VKERADGLSQAKKDQFRAEHGRLFCEDCGLDPVQHFHHDDGEAAIEAHHHEITLAEMQEPHDTALNELKLLCANCHRVVHRRMKREAKERHFGSGLD
jgi:5-methylcytosine-specific restriction protein A